MRKFIVAALAVLLLAPDPVRAADGNYNDGAASTASSTTANCQSALLRDGCAASMTEAPLPLTGAGPIGMLLVGGAGAAALLVRRRRAGRHG
ncbi:hypothetical protein ACFQS7_20425 [Dankookia sp. GCM10030260]|uniref:hypothetical protein n=1 Tax=Dankookia sp. GCM10030260 TaxID=3273390 RepID=UPI003606FE1C